MFKLDNAFLTNLGLGSLPVHEKNKLLQAIYERLEMNVGMRLAEKMTDDQLNEFEAFIDKNDEAGALRWLETNFPNYKQVVAEELEKLKQEVARSAPQILEAAQQDPLNQQPQPGQSPTPQQPQYGPQPQDGAMGQNPQYQQQAPQFGPEPAYQPSQQPNQGPAPWSQQPQPGQSPTPQQPQYGPQPNQFNQSEQQQQPPTGFTPQQ